MGEDAVLQLTDTTLEQIAAAQGVRIDRQRISRLTPLFQALLKAHYSMDLSEVRSHPVAISFEARWR